MNNDKKNAVIHLLKQIPLITLDYKSNTITIRRIARDTQVVLAPGDTKSNEFIPGVIQEAGVHKKTFTHLNNKRSIPDGVYSVRSDYLHAKSTILEGQKDPIIQISSRSSIEDGTSSDIIFLDTQVKISSVDDLLSEIKGLVSTSRNGAEVDALTLLSREAIMAQMKTASSYSLEDGGDGVKV